MSTQRTNKGHRVSRRAILAGLSAGALAPFVPVLNSSAGPTAYPKRLVLVFTPDGTLNGWKPSGSEMQFTPNAIHAPLAPYLEDLVFLYGLRQNIGGAGEAHAYGMAGLWTASKTNEASLFDGGNGNLTGWGSGISVDQAIAQKIGQDTAYASLEFAVQSKLEHVMCRMVYAGNDQPITPEDDPYAMFDRLFGDPSGSQTAADAERIRLGRQSVIDRVKGELGALEARLPSDDKQKLEAHLDSIRAIEKHLLAAPPACQPNALGDKIDVLANDNYPKVGRLQMELLAEALACDLTRVATIQFSRAGGGGITHTWLGHTETHHHYAHAANSDTQIKQINIWYAEQFAYLLNLLKSVPEGDGTLLDNTLVVWGREIATCSHGTYPTPFILAGGCGGSVKTGRFLDVGDIGHSRLLVTLCHLFGLTDVTKFGNLGVGGGPIGALIA